LRVPTAAPVQSYASATEPALLRHNDEAKSVVAQLIAIAQLAYEGDEGPELAYRLERFRK